MWVVNSRNLLYMPIYMCMLSWFNLAVGSYTLDSHSLTHPFPLSGLGRRNEQKVKLMDWDKTQFNKTTKEILILLPIMNMQNKLYTIQLSHHPMTSSQPASKQQSQNLELMDFKNFENSWKRLNSWKSSNSRAREDSNSWKREI